MLSKKQVAILPNVITALGLSFGLFVIFKAVLPLEHGSIYRLLHTSALLLLFTALADFIDGAVARLVKGESEFGILFDSLADAISFGVAPAILVLRAIPIQPRTPLSFLVIGGAMVYALCGILRLVRFTVHTNPYRNELVDEAVQKKNFTGLPIPAGAGVVVSINLLLHSPIFLGIFPITLVQTAILLACTMIVTGLLMVSRLKFPSLKTFHVRIRSVSLILGAVIIALLLLYGILYFMPILFTILAIGYVGTGLTLSLIRFLAGKQAKVLEDYDIEE